MDSDLSRLCDIPGTRDLTIEEVADVLSMSVSCVKRSTARPGQPHDPALPRIEAKRPTGRGAGIRRQVRYSRTAIVRYLVEISTGDRAAICAAVKGLCPQYLPAIADLMPGTQPVNLPSNVILMRKARGHTDKFAGHPDLFGASA